MFTQSDPLSIQTKGQNNFSIARFIEDMASFSLIDDGVTRFPLSPESSAARNYLVNVMTTLGLNVSIDGVGNVRGCLGGSNKQAKKLLIGSHFDSVGNAGKYDGIAGIASALGVIDKLRKNNINLSFPIEVIAFEGEEGCEFKSPFIGSKAVTGQLTAHDLKKIVNTQGDNYYDTCKAVGLQVEQLPSQQYTTDNLMGFIEVHIEQAATLDELDIPIGIVKAISGLRRMQLCFEGQANHAGATPMGQRRDALVGASAFIQSIDSILEKHTSRAATITAGRIECHPNRANIIPAKVTLEIDARDNNNIDLERLIQSIQDCATSIAVKNDLIFSSQILGEGPAVAMNEEFMQHFSQTCIATQTPFMEIHSGAGHDAGMFDTICPIGMLFIPSDKGYSHNPQEFTTTAQLEKSVTILYHTITSI